MVTDDNLADHQIVVGSDGSESSAAALEWAAAFAGRTGDGVLVVRSTKEPFPDGAPWAEIGDDPAARHAGVEAELGQLVDDARNRHPDVAWSARVEVGTPSEALIAAADEGRLLVVGNRGRGGFAGLLLGSTARKVVGHAPGTVVVVREPAAEAGPVVVGIDGSDHSRESLAWAAAEAARRNSRLRVVLAWSYLSPVGEHGHVAFTPGYSAEDAERVLASICADVLGDGANEAAVEQLAVCDLPARALLEQAAGASLLVTGPGRGSMQRRPDIGSVTAQLLQHAPCPLAIVRDEGPGQGD